MNADITGMRKLSSRPYLGTSSIIVTTVIAINEKNKSISGIKNKTIINQTTKKANLPSNDLSNILVFP